MRLNLGRGTTLTVYTVSLLYERKLDGGRLPKPAIVIAPGNNPLLGQEVIARAVADVAASWDDAQHGPASEWKATMCGMLSSVIDVEVNG